MNDNVAKLSPVKKSAHDQLGGYSGPRLDQVKYRKAIESTKKPKLELIKD